MFIKKFVSTFLVLITFFALIPINFCNSVNNYKTSLRKIGVPAGETVCFPYITEKKEGKEYFFEIRTLNGNDSDITHFRLEENGYDKFCVVNNGGKKALIEGRLVSDGPIDLNKVSDWSDVTILNLVNIIPLFTMIIFFNRQVFGIYQNHKIF